MIDMRAIRLTDLTEIEQEEHPNLILDITKGEIRPGIMAKGILYPSSSNHVSAFPPDPKWIFEEEPKGLKRARILKTFLALQEQHQADPHQADPDLSLLHDDVVKFFKDVVDPWNERQKENTMAEWRRASEKAKKAKGKPPGKPFRHWPNTLSRVFYKGVDLAETHAARNSFKPPAKDLGAEGVDLFTEEIGPLLRKAAFRVKGMTVGCGLNDKVKDAQSWGSDHGELTGIVYNPTTISNLYKFMYYRMQYVPVKVHRPKKKAKASYPGIYATTKDQKFLDNLLESPLDPETFMEALRAAVYGRGNQDAVNALKRSTAGLSLTVAVKQNSNAEIIEHTHGSYQQLSKAVAGFASLYKGVSLRDLIESSFMRMKSGGEVEALSPDWHIAKWIHRVFHNNPVRASELAHLLDIRERAERSAKAFKTLWTHFDWSLQGITLKHRKAQEAIMKTAFTQSDIKQSPFYYFGRMISALGYVHRWYYIKKGQYQDGNERSLSTIKELSAHFRTDPSAALTRMVSLFGTFEAAESNVGQEQFKELFLGMPDVPRGNPSNLDRVALLQGRFNEEDVCNQMIKDLAAKKKAKTKAPETPEPEEIAPWEE